MGFKPTTTILVCLTTMTPNKITIALNYVDFSFKIMTDYEMEYNTIQWTGASYDRNNLKSINQVLGNYTSSLNYPDWKKRIFDIISVEKLIPYL